MLATSRASADAQERERTKTDRKKLADRFGVDIARRLHPHDSAEALGLRFGRGGPLPHGYLVFQHGTGDERHARIAHVRQLALSLGLEPGGYHEPDVYSVATGLMLTSRLAGAVVAVDPTDDELRKLAGR